MDRDTILDAMTAERQSGLAGDGETFSLGFTLVHEGPRLHEMVFVEKGNGEGSHVAFVGRLGSGEAEEGEIELAVGGGRGGGLHGRLIPHGAVVGYEDAVAIERVHGDHVGFVAGVEALHEDTAVGDQFIGNLHLFAVRGGAFPLAGEGFELVESGRGACGHVHFLGSGECGDEGAEDESE